MLNSRDALIIGGDFNAKTRPTEEHMINTFKQNIGKYARNEINENGHMLLEFAKINNLRLTNTYFKHKPSHQTTWECPPRTNQIIDSKTKETRKNQYRNQIDYILIKKH